MKCLLLSAIVLAASTVFAGDGWQTDYKAALEQAAQAAAQGAEATKQFRAKFGRARNLGDRVIGHTDPGAVSVALIFKGFSAAL